MGRPMAGAPGIRVRFVKASPKSSAEVWTLTALVHYQWIDITTTLQNGMRGSFGRLKHFPQQSRYGNEYHEIETQTDRLCSPLSGCSRRFGGDTTIRIQRIGGCQWHLQSHGNGLRAGRTLVCLSANRPVARHQKRHTAGGSVSDRDYRLHRRTRVVRRGVRSRFREQPEGLHLLHGAGLNAAQPRQPLHREWRCGCAGQRDVHS